MHQYVSNRPASPTMPLWRAVATAPIHVAAATLELALWLTRDLGCSASGHDPHSVHGLIRCRRCDRSRTTDTRGRARWH